MAKKYGAGMASRTQGARSVFNLHNQGGDAGFTVEFLQAGSLKAFERGIEDGVIAIQETSIAAVQLTVDNTKQRLRTFFDGVFQKSGPTRNNHRRISNALVQSAYFNTVRGQPGFTGLIYSKLGRGFGPTAFIDYLLLHLRGGTVAPKTKQWLMLPVSRDAMGLKSKGGVPTGNYREAGTKVFFRPAKDDPEKLFLLRSETRTGKTTLLAVLLKSVRIPARVSELPGILSSAEAVFERNYDAVWRQRVGAEG